MLLQAALDTSWRCVGSPFSVAVHVQRSLLGCLGPSGMEDEG